MNNTTPRPLTVDSVAPIVNGIPTPAPQPMGTWFTRWHHLYTEAPAATAGSGTAPTLPERSQLTVAA